jgi:hypothetical protein
MPSVMFRFCRRCHGLFTIAQGLHKTRCPAANGGPHDDSASGVYALATKDEPVGQGDQFQQNWFECEKCEGLFLDGQLEKTPNFEQLHMQECVRLEGNTRGFCQVERRTSSPLF